jgi:1,4-alpha-glucan branching enzyme
MLTKRKLGRGKVRVTFTMPPLEGVKQLFLVGDFNNWSVAETPLTRAADESWSVTLTLDAGQDYEYRYYADGQVWHNDWAADGYVPNTFGTENSVVSLPAEAKPAKPAKPADAAKKKSASRKKA